MTSPGAKLYIVDTHAVIWLTDDRTRLSKAAEDALRLGRLAGTLAIADITLREISFLVQHQAVKLSKPLGIYLHFVQNLFRVLPVDAAIAERSIRFAVNYPKDPADQLIGATAIVNGGKLITKDKLIRLSKEVECIW